MGSYYESLGRGTEESGYAAEYWEDLGKLLEQDAMKGEKTMTKLRFCQESVNQIIFLSNELYRAGISLEQQRQILQILRQKTEQAAETYIGSESDEGLVMDREEQEQDTEEVQSTEEELIREIISRIQTAEEILEHGDQK